MNKEETIKHLNSFRSQFLNDMGCTIVDVDLEQASCTMNFDISERYCHSGDIIQGGFVTTMLDSVTTHAAFASNSNIRTLATLELKVSFFEASRKGKFKAIGKVEKMTKNFAFLRGDLFNEAGQRTASITATSKISLKTPS